MHIHVHAYVYYMSIGESSGMNSACMGTYTHTLLNAEYINRAADNFASAYELYWSNLTLIDELQPVHIRMGYTGA